MIKADKIARKFVRGRCKSRDLNMKSAMNQYGILLSLVCFIVVTAPCNLRGATIDKHVAQIDKLVNGNLQKQNIAPNASISNDQFLRRIYLDVIGRIPTIDEVNKFKDDTSPNKRTLLIDALLDSDGYKSHLFNWLADMFRVKSNLFRSGSAATYIDWIKNQISINRRWNLMVYDLLTAEGNLVKNGAAGYLLRDASMLADSLSNTMTIFLGANVACAQCHDHPKADWSQREFYEMAAFFGTTRFARDNANGIAKRMENDEVSYTTLSRVLQPNISRVEPQKKYLKYPEDYAYDDAKPNEKVKPSFINWYDSTMTHTPVNMNDPETYRKQFARWMVSPKNPRFATAIANRLWKRMFGFGVQEPVSDLDDKDAATNPELLAYLTEVMKKTGFDIKKFQRIILNTDAYQRATSEVPPHGTAYHFPGPVLRRLTAEQVWDSAVVIVRGSDVDSIVLSHGDKIRQMALPSNMSMDKRSLVKNKTKVIHHIKQIYNKVQSASDQNGNSMLSKKMDKGKKQKGKKGKGKKGKKDQGVMAMSKAEQVKETQMVASMKMEKSMFNYKKKRRGLDNYVRASELQQPSNAAHFLHIAGQSERNVPDDGSTEGGITESLAMMNGAISKFIMTRKGELMRAVTAKNIYMPEKIELLYQGVLSRKPSPQEAKIALDATRNGLNISDVLWALMNGREFMFIQ